MPRLRVGWGRGEAVSHQCDRYEIMWLPGVSFCRKGGARLVAEKIEDLKRQLAEVTAERDALKTALSGLVAEANKAPVFAGREGVRGVRAAGKFLAAIDRAEAVLGKGAKS